MKLRTAVSWLGVWAFMTVPALSQKGGHFYNVDKEKQVEGKIEKIVMEPRYRTTSPFLILVLKDKKSALNYNVEISPAWFFSQNFHIGEDLRVLGSYYSDGDTHNLIARKIRFKGKWFELRDKHGFPIWSGGRMMHMGRHRRKKY